MSIVLQSSGGGQITIQEPATASNFTQTLPAATGTVMVSGNQPAFSAYLNGSQTLSANTATKITFDVEEFDTNSNFASSRFTPTVAGYYQVSGGLSPGAAVCGVLTMIYKNGSVYKNIFSYQSTTTGNGGFGSTLVYLNGTTDYVELYGFLTVGQSVLAGIQFTYFNGALVRAA